MQELIITKTFVVKMRVKDDGVPFDDSNAFDLVARELPVNRVTLESVEVSTSVRHTPTLES